MEIVMKKVILKFEIKFFHEAGTPQTVLSKETQDNLNYATWVIQLSARGGINEDPLDQRGSYFPSIFFDVEPKNPIKEALDVIDYKFKTYENGILRSVRYISETPNKLKWRGKINDCNWPISSLVFDCYIELYRSVNVSLKIVDDFEKMFQTTKFFDVVLNCAGEREFKAHKAVLSVRSPVFEAMFENDLEETRKNEVKITDIDPEVLKELLSFIYCGKISKFENCCDLFVAADKYQIEDLMEYCHMYLLNNINENNLIHCLRLAETYNKKELKENAIEFFIKNEDKMTNLMENKDWKDMVSDCPGLANEIMKAFFAKLNRNNNKNFIALGKLPGF